MAQLANIEFIYAEVLLPLAIPQTYTYGIPIELQSLVKFGIRVEVPLRNKLYSGLVTECHSRPPLSGRTRNIISVIDQKPIIGALQFKFWQWLSDYYCANLGEVLNVALPSGLKLASESKYVLNRGVELDELSLSDDEYLVTEALSIQSELTSDIIQDILDKKTIYPVIKSLMDKRVLTIQEELKQRYKPKKEDFLTVVPSYAEAPDEALELTKRSEKQSRALLAILGMQRKGQAVLKKAIYQKANVDNSVIKALEKKGLIVVEAKEVSRIENENVEEHKLDPLTTDQENAKKLIQDSFESDKVALLHGITGSGKTRIYVDLILQVLKSGGQALLLLPEIALTKQIFHRLQEQISGGLLAYHSKINDHHRVEIWNAALTENKLFVGARSALFLPFSNLQLIIVDEEHDPSYKQDNPSPRYQARDSAIMLAKLCGANVLLGSATPSLESILNCKTEKFSYVPLRSRYGAAELPSVEIVDLKEAYKKGLVVQSFSRKMVNAIQQTVENGEQVILFQNRRGYAPIQRCNFCGWTAECPNCDVTLTYHRGINDLKCHFCGYRHRTHQDCPACGTSELQLIGVGTQRIEETLKELLPELRIGRFDYDTTRSKGAQDRILFEFKTRQLDVLVGTQMITKGFDFENISLVGILNADSLLSYPDFRAAERSFQLLVQVSGRAGRRKKPGRVIIQAFSKDHPVLKDVLSNDLDGFYARELNDRQIFVFPPYFFLITIWFRHKDFQTTKSAATKFTEGLQSNLGKRVQGPIDPTILRIRNLYQQIVHVRIEKHSGNLMKIKKLIGEMKKSLKRQKQFSSVRVTIDVDPY